MAATSRYTQPPVVVTHMYRYMAAVWPPDVKNGQCWLHRGPPRVGKHRGRRVKSIGVELVTWLGQAGTWWYSTG